MHFSTTTSIQLCSKHTNNKKIAHCTMPLRKPPLANKFRTFLTIFVTQKTSKKKDLSASFFLFTIFFSLETRGQLNYEMQQNSSRRWLQKAFLHRKTPFYSDVIQSFLLMIVCFWGLFQNPKMVGQWRGVTFKKLN